MEERMEKVALITGGSTGLGAALAAFVGGRGDRVIVDARGERALRALERELAARASRVTALVGDVTDPAHREALVRAARDHGRLDLLVNNASTLGPSPLPALADVPLDALHRLFATNVVAPLALIQELVPLLERSNGLIVNVSSDAARGGYPGWGAYGASKAALDLISLTLASELRPRGIGVVAVDPGDMRTAMHQAAYPGEDISDRPLPEITLPFWAWLLEQDPRAVTGRRFEARAERWEVAA
jgi:NAD(P)-dependent dehydrogenase (short-subunit alcohol dehydrogenase family)